jgi:hypothetical protein
VSEASETGGGDVERVSFFFEGHALTYKQAGQVVSYMLAKRLGLDPSRVAVLVYDVPDRPESVSLGYHVEIDGDRNLSAEMTERVAAFLRTFHDNVTEMASD